MEEHKTIWCLALPERIVAAETRWSDVIPSNVSNKTEVLLPLAPKLPSSTDPFGSHL